MQACLQKPRYSWLKSVGGRGSDKLGRECGRKMGKLLVNLFNVAYEVHWPLEMHESVALRNASPGV